MGGRDQQKTVTSLRFHRANPQSFISEQKTHCPGWSVALDPACRSLWWTQSSSCCRQWHCNHQLFVTLLIYKISLYFKLLRAYEISWAGSLRDWILFVCRVGWVQLRVLLALHLHAAALHPLYGQQVSSSAISFHLWHPRNVQPGIFYPLSFAVLPEQQNRTRCKWLNFIHH